jgi:hypothetical protein
MNVVGKKRRTGIVEKFKVKKPHHVTPHPNATVNRFVPSEVMQFKDVQ